jgi:hypothetical protein
VSSKIEGISRILKTQERHLVDLIGSKEKEAVFMKNDMCPKDDK